MTAETSDGVMESSFIPPEMEAGHELEQPTISLMEVDPFVLAALADMAGEQAPDDWASVVNRAATLLRNRALAREGNGNSRKRLRDRKRWIVDEPEGWEVFLTDLSGTRE